MAMNPQMPSGWAFTDADDSVSRSVRARLPDRLFDVHMHPYRRRDVRPVSPIISEGPATAGLPEWRTFVGRQLGSRRLRGSLCIPFPSRKGIPEEVNDYVLGITEGKRNYRPTVLLRPDSPRESIVSLLDRHPHIAGFKAYHLLSPSADTFQCEIREFLPPWVWSLAHDRGLLIMLHMVKDAALSDPANLRTLRDMCERHPNAKLILAHSARGFHAPNTVRAIARLRGLQNIWFDTSGICESDATAAILQEFGPTRVMWGSDFPISQQRGRAVTLGTGFAWVATDQVKWNDRAYFGEPVLVGLESTQAMLDACDRIGLNRQDLENICCDNAMRLLGLKDEPGDKTQALYRHAKTIIPGGSQLLSKRPEMAAPGQWPAYYSEARGCEVWDLDGRHYFDCGFHGIGATLLGFRDPDVTRAVLRRVNLGSLCTLNTPDEVELADRLCRIHPWASQARFARAGGEAMAVAVRIARATTDRSAVAVCGYHGWHDWYLAANLGSSDALRGHLLPGLDPLGVPRELRGTTFPFTYNNRGELKKIIGQHGKRLAAIVMEPCRYADPEPGFLEFVRDAAHRAGALLIFDEITIGWRLNYGGAHLRFGVDPDMAVFGKTLSNGHLMAAVIGTAEAMEGAHGSFISSSYWTEGVGPAAALAALDKMRDTDVPGHCRRTGTHVQKAWRRLIRAHRLPASVDRSYPALAHFSFEGELANELKTLFVQHMLDRGFLATTSIYVTLAHTEAIIDKYTAAVDEAFAELARALRDGTVRDELRGPPAHTGFRRLL